MLSAPPASERNLTAYFSPSIVPSIYSTIFLPPQLRGAALRTVPIQAATTAKIKKRFMLPPSYCCRALTLSRLQLFTQRIEANLEGTLRRLPKMNLGFLDPAINGSRGESAGQRSNF